MPKEFYIAAKKFRKEHRGRMSLEDLKQLMADFRLQRAISKAN